MDKICSKCHILKKISHFGNKKSTKDGLNYQCRECVKDYCKLNSEKIKKYKQQYHINNREELNKKLRDYYHTNKNKTVIDKKKKSINWERWYLKNKENVLKRVKKYREEKSDKVKEIQHKWREKNPNYSKEYYTKNPDKYKNIKKTQKTYNIKNKDKKRKYRREYNQENKGIINAKTAKYRAKKLKATPPWLTDSHLNEIADFYKDAQEIRWLSEIPFHVDHIIPLQGKTVSGLHVPWNLQILTQHDNNVKSNKIN